MQFSNEKYDLSGCVGYTNLAHTPEKECKNVVEEFLIFLQYDFCVNNPWVKAICSNTYERKKYHGNIILQIKNKCLYFFSNV